MEYTNDVAYHYDMARKSYSLGDYEQARRHYESTLDQTHPGDDHAAALYWEYSRCLYAMGECAEVLSMVEQGLSHYPDCRELFYIRGQIYYGIGLLEQSNIDLYKCTVLKTRFPNEEAVESVADYKVYWYLSVISARTGKCEELLHYLRLFITERPPLPALNQLFSLVLKSGIDKKSLIKSLTVDNEFPHKVSCYLLLTMRAYAAYLQLINLPGDKGELQSQWMKCQLYLGRYNEVQRFVEQIAANTPVEKELIVYYCVSKWLETPRRSTMNFLMNLDINTAEVQVCLLIENLIFNHIYSPIDETVANISTLIKEISLQIYLLGDTCLAFDIVKNFFSWDRTKAYFEIGRKAFDYGLYQEAKVLLERSLSQEEENAETYFILGIVCGRLDIYEQALEYFLGAVALQPENRVYPCMAFEALAQHSINILLRGSNNLADRPELIKELLRLCTIKRKSRRLRQIIVNENIETGRLESIYSQFDIWLVGDDIDEEGV